MDSRNDSVPQAVPEQAEFPDNAWRRNQWFEYSGYLAMGVAVLAFSGKFLHAVLPDFPFAICTYIGILVFLFVAARVGTEQPWTVTIFFGTLLRDLCKSCAVFPYSLCSWASRFSRRMFSPTQRDGEVLLDLLGPFAQKLWKLIAKLTAAQDANEHDERRPSLQREDGHFAREYNPTDQAESVAFWFTWIIALIGLFCTLRKYSSMSMDNVLTIILIFLIYLVLKLLAFTIIIDLPAPPSSPPATEGVQNDGEESQVPKETNKRCGNFRRLSIKPHPNGDRPRSPRWGRRCSKNLSPVRLRDLKRAGIPQNTSSPKPPKSDPTPPKPHSPSEPTSREPHIGRDYTGFYDARTNTHRSTDDKQPVRQEDPVKERKELTAFMLGIAERMLILAREARRLQMTTFPFSVTEKEAIEKIRLASYQSLETPRMIIRQQNFDDHIIANKLSEKSARQLYEMLVDLSRDIDELINGAGFLPADLSDDQIAGLGHFQLHAQTLRQTCSAIYQHFSANVRERAQRDAEMRLETLRSTAINLEADPCDITIQYSVLSAKLKTLLAKLREDNLVSQDLIAKIEPLIRECHAQAPELADVSNCRIKEDRDRGQELIRRLEKTVTNGCLPSKTESGGYLCSVRAMIMSLRAAGAFKDRPWMSAEFLMSKCFENFTFTGAIHRSNGIPRPAYQQFIDQDVHLKNFIRAGDFPEIVQDYTRLSEIGIEQLRFMLRFLMHQGYLEANYRLFVITKTYADDGDQWRIQEFTHPHEEYEDMNLDNINIAWLYNDNAENVQEARLKAPYHKKGKTPPNQTKLCKDAGEVRHIGHYQGFSTNVELHGAQELNLVQAWHLPGPRSGVDEEDEEL